MLVSVDWQSEWWHITCDFCTSDLVTLGCGLSKPIPEDKEPKDAKNKTAMRTMLRGLWWWEIVVLGYLWDYNHEEHV